MTEGPQDNVYQRFANTLARTQWLSRAELDLYRQSLLKRLVKFAFQESPFYRERLKPLFCHGPEPRLEAWREVPLLRRADLKLEMDRLIPRQLPPEAGAVSKKRTSGTTGEPCVFQTCTLARIAAECMMHRHYCWHDLDLSAPMASVRFYGSSQRGYPTGVTEKNWCAIQPEATHHTLDVREQVANIIRWLDQRAPKYLLTFPSLMQDLVHHPDAGAVASLRLGKIIGISESLTNHLRHIVQEKLGCNIAQIYACAEMGCIALQAPSDDHYLACEESVFVEVLDDREEAVAPGQTGRVVLTSLYNYATPFIRYEIGDYASLAASSCPSGRALTRLRCIHGRRSNSLRAADGRRVWPGEIPFSELATHLSSSRFQIRQPDQRSIVINVAAARDARPDEKGVAATFSRLLGSAMNVRIARVDDLDRTNGGKRDLVVSSVS